MSLNLRGRPFEHVASVIDDQDTVGDFHHQVHVVLDNEDRQSVAAQHLDAVEQHLDFRGIKAGGRLIDHQRRGAVASARAISSMRCSP